MTPIRDFDAMTYGQNDDVAGMEQRLQLTDFAFLETLPKRRPFLAKMRSGLRALAQISQIRIHIILEMREPIV